MAPLFSKADLNKFRHDVQNEVALICTKFGKDLFSISKVISCKTKWPGFLAYPVYVSTLCLRKKGPTLKRYGSKLYGSILMIFGRNIQKSLE